MANVTRRAKAVNDWNDFDLAAYNIRVEYQDATTFFDPPRLPDPIVTAEEVLEVTRPDQTTTDDGYALLRMLQEAIDSIMENEESAVHNFAAELFRACGYTWRGRFVRTRKDILFLTCGEFKYAKADACILNDKDQVILLVHEHRSHFHGVEHEDQVAQLIVKSIAAFTELEYKSERSCHLPFKIMPGIIFHGVSPTFYKISVSEDLVTAIEWGQYPKQETVVLAHVPTKTVLVPYSCNPDSEGMWPLHKRRVILSCFEAFKRFVN